MQLPTVLCKKCGQEHPITDVYCDHLESFLPEYPPWLIGGLITGGVVVFLVVAFLGYGYADHLGAASQQSCPTPFVPPASCMTDGWQLFAKPWPLFLWLCALMFTLVASILRQVRRRYLVSMLLLMLASIVAVAAIDHYGLSFGGVIRRFLTWLSNLLTNPETYVVLNWGVVGIFFLDAAYRWIARALGRKPVLNLTGEPTEPADFETPMVQELVAGDLIVGAVLLFALAIFFSAPIRLDIARLAPTMCLDRSVGGLGVQGCADPGNTFAALFADDRDYGLLSAAFGLVIFFISSVLSSLDIQPDTTPAAGARAPVGVIDRIGRALGQFARGVSYRRTPLGLALLLSPRIILTPGLIFLAVLSLGAYSKYEQVVLHGGASNAGALLLANAFLLVAVFATPAAASLQLMAGRVWTNSLGLIRWVAVTTLPLYWAAALGLFLFNLFLYFVGWVPPTQSCQTHHTQLGTWVSLPPFIGGGQGICHQPYALSWIFFISLGSGAIVGAILVVRRLRGHTSR